jgi:ABC-2 type transport system permease protein
MMFDDIKTVMWKERKGLFRVQGSRARAILTVLVPVVMIAVVMPLQMGREWLDAAWSLLGSILIPFILVGITIPESFAGERERHTLETLLASRLPDRAILFGKVVLAVAYGWGMTLVVLVVSLVTVNLLHWDGRVMFYKPVVALANVAVSLLIASLVANLGVLISLRSATAQGAQQALMSAILIPLMVLQLVPTVMLSVVPNGRKILKQWLSVDFTQVVLVLIAVLLAASLGLLLAAMARFQRSRLTLD